MKRNYRLQGLDCAHCAAKMENSIKKIEGVVDASVNFMTLKLTLEFKDDYAEHILEAIEKAVHKVDDQVIVKRA
ncbi:MAG: cation transporter [Erysipelotrichaceae bacterium]